MKIESVPIDSLVFDPANNSICKNCHTSFFSRNKKKLQKYCSVDCRRNWHKSKAAFKEKILDAISIDDASKCWNWSKSISKYGYGKFGMNGKHWRAHRLSFEIFKGEIHQNKLVLHHCDNRKCVNPEHLYLGDHYQNAQDIKKRNRTYLISEPKRGGNNPCAKLNDDIVIKIRAEIKNGELGKNIAKNHNVSVATISMIKNNKIWNHI